MRNRLSDKIKESGLRKNMTGKLLGEFKYVVSALAALWMSAWFGGMCKQFLVLAVILGLKWVFSDQKQVIQIFTQEGGADEGK
jgi:hypothetical protein